MEKICVLCGSKFESRISKAKYCHRTITKRCKACGKEFTTECFAGAPDYCSRTCVGTAPPSATQSKVCPLCGDTFTPTNGNQQYCMQTKVARCKVCNKEFTYVCTLHGSGSKVVCSRECRNIYARNQTDNFYKQRTAICKICGEEFTPTNNTSSICLREHSFNCVICGKQFTIPRYRLSESKLRATCSDECSRKLHSQNNGGSRPEAIEKRKQTCLARYGVEHPSQSPEIQAKMRKTYFDRTGYDHASHNPEVRSKSAKSAKVSKLESKIQSLFDNYDIQYESHYMISSGDRSHEFDFYLPKYKILIDADGVYYHSYLGDPDGKHAIDYYDDIRISLIPEDHQFYLIIEGTEEKAVKQIVEILQKIDDSIFNYDSYLFNWCRSIEFPYPEYSQSRMLQDWTNLCKYQNSSYVNQCRIGESIIATYHKSIYDCHVGTSASPIEAWYDDEKLKKVIKNRLIYVNNVDPSKILRGFNVSKICPKVSVFNPILAKYLINKYLSEFNTVFDPFSGFSGRLLGAAACGKTYIGQDLNCKAVAESNQIIEFLNLQKVSVSVKDVLTSTGSYDCLLTCPPYNKKEIYNSESVFHTCDEWIDECLTRFNCTKYVFVVDSTSRYTEYVVEELKSTSHFNKTSETVIVIDKISDKN